MPNNGAIAIAPTTTDQSIAAGYHNGSGTVQGDPDLAAGNIKNGVNLFGVAGTLYNAGVPKTGQTTSFATGDDGDLEKGVAWPNPRFITGTTGVVTDTLTGLIWLKNANCANAGEKMGDRHFHRCGVTEYRRHNQWQQLRRHQQQRQPSNRLAAAQRRASCRA